MAYTDDSVKAKLSALNETQESIVTVAQWIMFHRRHADRTATLWYQRMKDSGAGKRLNLIYLANEVAQQSKARKKDDFLIAFSPIIAEATATAYKGATSDVQAKVKRVVEVWRQRQIFEQSIQEAVEARILEIDRARAAGRKPLLGSSIFSTPTGASAPAELQPLVPIQNAVSKAALAIENSVPTANTEYGKLMDSQGSPPPAPVYAARLSAMLKTLVSAEGAVSESIKARRDLISGLEKLLETNRTALANEESQSAELESRKGIVEAKKREVEDAIVRGLSTDDSSTPARDVPGRESTTNGNQDLDRPQVEALTPPPVEALTPVGSPPPGLTQGTASSQDLMDRQLNPTPLQAPPQAGFDLLSSLSLPPARMHVHNPANGNPPNKKRKIEPDFVDYSAADAMEDLDEDVAELLRAESGGH